MIIYNENFKILGMGQKALELFNFASVSEFLSTHKNISELIIGHENQSDKELIEKILLSQNKRKKLHLRDKDDKILSVVIYVNTFSKVDDINLYEVDIDVQNEELEQNQDNKEHTRLRLPVVISSNQISDIIHKQSKKKIEITDEWLDQTAGLLNLSKKEFIEYLDIITQSAKRLDIPLQNAIITQDTNNIKKLLLRLKEPCMNFRITPLVRAINEILQTETINYHELISTIKECINSLEALIQKHQGTI
ncbi:hypothetical protein [Campylobacter mucosalis]|uniref:hypothetical protein n=1 Tax=Campylobacter mucosalis TaxID=202 RepID=UPI0014705DEB|nr:hypothetical protein [Campylobacter mucosalis]